MVVLGGTLAEASGLGLGCMSVSGQYGALRLSLCSVSLLVCAPPLSALAAAPPRSEGST